MMIYEKTSDEMTVDKMTIEEMTANKMTVDKKTIDEMTSDEMTVDDMTIDKMTVDEMTADEMTEDSTKDSLKMTSMYYFAAYIEKQNLFFLSSKWQNKLGVFVLGKVLRQSFIWSVLTLRVYHSSFVFIRQSLAMPTSPALP
jgi:hypothetical protein